MKHESAQQLPLRELAAHAFSRAAGAPLISGNRVRLLEDAGQNYPAWLEAIAGAKRHVHAEMYFFSEDEVGREFADTLISRARAGVQVRLVYDWLGAFSRASRSFWNVLGEGGVQVRCYNPLQLDSPFGWISRDHRKLLTVDGEVGFVSGLCVSSLWRGDPSRGIAPWRDTGVEIRGPAVAEIERAFAGTWASFGEPAPLDSLVAPLPAGTVSLRIVATEPSTAGMLRLDQLIAALARKRLWITDPYYAGTPSHVQALRAAALDGVDVRLLVPGASDIPVLQPLSRTGYRALLQAGVRVFEWNGSMLHAKTAVADGRWGRVGSTNLNLASWLGNRELDAVIEDQAFGASMEQVYERDLSSATEVVLDIGRKLRAPGRPHRPRAGMGGGRGSANRAAAGALRIGNALGAAFAGRRVLGPVEARLMLAGGALIAACAILIALFPRLLAYPLAALAGWFACALIFRAWRLRSRAVDARDGSRGGELSR